MKSLGVILIVFGIGLLVFASDLFGYTNSVKSDVQVLVKKLSLTKEETQRLAYYKWTALVKKVGYCALLSGVVALSVSYIMEKTL